MALRRQEPQQRHSPAFDQDYSSPGPEARGGNVGKTGGVKSRLTSQDRLKAVPKRWVMGMILAMALMLTALPAASQDFQKGAEAYRRGDFATALDQWKRLAEGGNAAAQNNLGTMYQLGQGTPKNPIEAANWYRKAADQGLVYAQNNLALMYLTGEGVGRNFTQAAMWYRKAALQGHADAQFTLANLHRLGIGVAQDEREAVKWYRKAAQQGLAAAQSNLGYMYHKGKGVAQDHAKAMKWYRKAARQGLAAAQSNLGLMYQTGKGAEQDYAEAMKWYRMVAERQDRRGAHRPPEQHAKGPVTASSGPSKPAEQSRPTQVAERPAPPPSVVAKSEEKPSPSAPAPVTVAPPKTAPEKTPEPAPEPAEVSSPTPSSLVATAAPHEDTQSLRAVTPTVQNPEPSHDAPKHGDEAKTPKRPAVTADQDTAAPSSLAAAAQPAPSLPESPSAIEPAPTSLSTAELPHEDMQSVRVESPTVEDPEPPQAATAQGDNAKAPESPAVAIDHAAATPKARGETHSSEAPVQERGDEEPASARAPSVASTAPSALPDRAPASLPETMPSIEDVQTAKANMAPALNPPAPAREADAQAETAKAPMPAAPEPSVASSAPAPAAEKAPAPVVASIPSTESDSTRFAISVPDPLRIVDPIPTDREARPAQADLRSNQAPAIAGTAKAPENAARSPEPLAVAASPAATQAETQFALQMPDTKPPALSKSPTKSQSASEPHLSTRLAPRALAPKPPLRPETSDAEATVATYRDWMITAGETDGQKTCSLMTLPRGSAKDRNADAPHVRVPHKLSSGYFKAPRIILGEAAKPGSKIMVVIDKKRYSFDPAEKTSIVTAKKRSWDFLRDMLAGIRMTVRFTSWDNTPKVYEYSLLGFTRAYRQTKKKCRGAASKEARRAASHQKPAGQE